MNQNQPESIEIPLRYNPPTRLDFAYWGSIMRVSDENERLEMYIQTSLDPESPKWITIGELFASTGCFKLKQIEEALIEYCKE